MMLTIISQYLHELLKIDEIPDFSGAKNGLQLENSGNVTKIAAAVDAHLPVIEKATEIGADLLLVHHGMFWQGAQMIQGRVYKKLKLAMDRELAVFSAHHPLDVHPKFGNNAVLAKALGLKNPEPFFFWKGTAIGMKFETKISRGKFLEKVEKATGTKAHLCPGGPETIRSVGICTGGAGGEIYDVAQQGVDTFVTGEGPHWSYTSAEELGMNLIYGGHYATETFGVKALAAHLSKKFDIPWEFIDHPTGM